MADAALTLQSGGDCMVSTDSAAHCEVPDMIDPEEYSSLGQIGAAFLAVRGNKPALT